MSQCFPPYKGDSTDFILNLSNYATKDDLKNITHVDVSGFALKTNLAIKTKVHKLDVDKLNLEKKMIRLKKLSMNL